MAVRNPTLLIKEDSTNNMLYMRFWNLGSRVIFDKVRSMFLEDFPLIQYEYTEGFNWMIINSSVQQPIVKWCQNNGLSLEKA